MYRTAVMIPALLVTLGSLAAQTGSKAAETGKPSIQVQSTLNQLMRGVLYPASNVVFSAQVDDPAHAEPLPGQDPSMATDPTKSTFRGWDAIENAALALAESTNLLLIPGRSCSNGVPAPIADPDWQRFVQQLRDASMTAYQAARSKDLDKMVEVADTLTTACAVCHRKWREKRAADRCK